jgi:hypothetical protein
MLRAERPSCCIKYSSRNPQLFALWRRAKFISGLKGTGGCSGCHYVDTPELRKRDREISSWLVFGFATELNLIVSTRIQDFDCLTVDRVNCCCCVSQSPTLTWWNELLHRPLPISASCPNVAYSVAWTALQVALMADNNTSAGCGSYVGIVNPTYIGHLPPIISLWKRLFRIKLASITT